MTTEPIDCYAVLGVARDATQAQISVAYRTLLRRYHPDTRLPADISAGTICDAALQHVLTAYAVLRDPVRRFDYDQRTTPRSAPARPQARRSGCHGYVRSTIHPSAPDPSTGHPDCFSRPADR